MSLQIKIDALCHITHELLNLGFDGTLIYSNDFCRLNKEVYRQAEALYPLNGSCAEEEARLCYALLSAYYATIYDYGNKNLKAQNILNRSWEVLKQLPCSLLKCQLLVACYSNTFDEGLAKEAHAIINTWCDRDLTLAEQEVLMFLECLEETPSLSWEEIE